ncbi:MAG TPA: AAA family ATPase [Bryobacteraceae bacterium]|nr:AAA family ATPase [Bryobacteraceae bacterium]
MSWIKGVPFEKRPPARDSATIWPSSLAAITHPYDRLCMRFENPNLFVISGGPGSGKTTLLGELAKFGFRYAPEVARQIIQEQLQSGGKALPWNDRETYTRLMLQRSIEFFCKHMPASRQMCRTPTFADRGIPDTLLRAPDWSYRHRFH